MLEKLKSFSLSVFYILFSLCFSYLILHMLIENSQYEYIKIWLYPLILIGLGILTFVYSLFKRYEKQMEKNYTVIITVFLILMAIIQLVFGNLLRFVPAWDMESIYGGAIQWVTEGDFTRYYDYYGWFPNNRGAMTFLFVIFKIANSVGVKDYFMVATILNCFLSIGTMLVATSIVKKIMGTRYALTTLFFFALSPPFYFIAPAFYTDALSMFFPVLIYYLYLVAREKEKLSTRILLYACIGLAAGVGMEVKFTVSIMVIAILIDALLHIRVKETLIMTSVLAVPIIIIFISVNAVLYGNHLNREDAKKYNTPYLHWVMMGLKGNGSYNPDDYEFTRSFTNPKDRNAALRTEILNRIRNHGPNGMLDLLTKKGERIFGDGTYALSDFLDDTPLNDTFLHSYILYDGKNYVMYRHLCQGIYMAIFILMLFSGLQEIFSDKKRFRTFLAPRLAIFGVLLFFSFWETSGRYFTNFIPMIFISAIMGIDYLVCMVQKTHRKIIMSLQGK